MATPCILVTSCSEFSPENIVKDILRVETLQVGTPVIESIVSYDWSIDTKYYTADVRVCVTKDRTIGNQEFAESVQAFIAYFDANKKETFGSVKLWNSYLNEIDPEIKMLVCERCLDSSAVGRLEAQTWCIDNGFELVELNPEPLDNDSDLEDDFVETTGIKRIIQSLHAHTWPNLNLKDSRHSVSPFIRQLMKEEHDAKKSGNDLDEDIINAEDTVTENPKLCTQNNKPSNIGENEDSKISFPIDKSEINCEQSVTKDKQSCEHCVKTEEDLKKPDGENCDMKAEGCAKCSNKEESENKGTEGATEGACVDPVGRKTETDKPQKNVKQPSKEERLDSLLPAEDMTLFEALGSEDPGGESFEKLFERFAKMKERASGLPFEERKKYAENVAIAFWKAIGGDEDEIGDLDSDG